MARSQRPEARGPAMAENASLLCLLETKSSGLAVSIVSTRGTLHSEAKGHRGYPRTYASKASPCTITAPAQEEQYNQLAGSAGSCP